MCGRVRQGWKIPVPLTRGPPVLRSETVVSVMTRTSISVFSIVVVREDGVPVHTFGWGPDPWEPTLFRRWKYRRKGRGGTGLGFLDGVGGDGPSRCLSPESNLVAPEGVGETRVIASTLTGTPLAPSSSWEKTFQFSLFFSFFVFSWETGGPFGTRDTTKRPRDFPKGTCGPVHPRGRSHPEV